MTEPFDRLTALERRVLDLALADSPPEVFRILLDAARLGAPRAAVFLARGGRWRGWGSTGHEAEAARRLRETELPLDSGWLGALGSAPEGTWRSAGPFDALPDFGQAPADETIGVPLRIGGRPVAVLAASRGSGESPWAPEAIAILAHVGRLRLEIDLARRRSRASPVAEPRAPEPERPPDALPVQDPETTAIVPVEEPPSGDDRALEDARRFARLVATEIRLYNEEDVLLGRRHRDLARRLADSIERGRQSFARRFPALGEGGLDILRDAYVQVLGGGDSSLFPSS